MSKNTILSILGLEHSGTTLLARVLNNHPEAISIGGIKNLTRFAAYQSNCSCGSGYGACAFWSSVEYEFKKRGHQLSQVSEAIKSSNKPLVKDLFTSVSISTGKNLLIESSRQPAYLDLLPGAPDFASVAIHIFKHPGDQAWSAYRAGRNVLREIRHYRRRSFAILRQLENHTAAIHVSHENFCDEPTLHLRRLLLIGGFDLGKSQLESWGEKQMHIIGGNKMLKNRSSIIKKDRSWRETLPLVYRAIAIIIGGSAYKKNLIASKYCSGNLIERTEI